MDVARVIAESIAQHEANRTDSSEGLDAAGRRNLSLVKLSSILFPILSCVNQH